MIRLRTAKVLAVVFLGIFFGAYVYHDEVRWTGRGRDAFLIFQNRRFDRTIAHPHHLLGLMISGILATAIFIGFYELLSFWISKVVPGPATSRSQE